MAVVMMTVASANACTNLIVGKKASTDGSVICSYNADSYGAYMPPLPLSCRQASER